MNDMRTAIDDAIFVELSKGKGDRDSIRNALAISESEMTAAICRLRALDLVDLDTLELTSEGVRCAYAMRATKGQRRGDPISVPNAATPDASSPPRRGWTRTRSPADIIRRISAEMELADPRQAMSIMAQHWPEAARRMEGLAADAQLTLHALFARALAAGVATVEAELRG